MGKRSRPRVGPSVSHWPTGRRVAVLAAVLAILLTVAGIAAYLTQHGTGRDTGPTARPPASASPPAASQPGKTASTSGTGAVSPPPRLADPLAYARAAAVMLWSYDTRATTRDQQLAGMHAWMTAETKYTDWASIQAQVPDPLLWSRMGDNAQYATATVAEAHFPSAFKQALAEDPAALTEAYIYAVTVTGKQSIAWKDGGGGAEDRSVTLAVQCRPSTDCALVAIAPNTAP
ncbi:hypothetical protein BJP40_03875 [Streptomyces sp. CC53]|uniref:hypothetical protein n=1 Tax=unclassified Streptomyces TaxID=2593676 RepID=UPI0008DD47A7|nr:MULTISPECIES: hypothetical protein [unclassified Streptomyces]OII62150.1 hypothetical protein BJP40_03875 [Streptomyces sp. CC53]